ncbi:GNAT family N-acetyltransferase [Neobacillus sp. SCS-31]|uniref:GNAT family N-acetyltransferase n=1 Tax=Neobacillus oceani TaxID=3115292 RepID=UPI003906C3DC
MKFEMESERLTFTKLVESDWELFRSINTDPKLMKHIRTVRSEEAIRNTFEKELASWSLTSTHWLTWIIREKASNKEVGMISIYSHDGEKRVAEVGFILLEAAQGKGYGTEAIRSVIKFGIDTFAFEKFTAVCSEDHLASRRVLEKVGMKLEEVLPENTEINGRLVNDCFYSRDI